MPRTRKTHSADLKAKVAIEAIKGERTHSEIAQTFGVHPNLVSAWRKQVLELLPTLFKAAAPLATTASHDREKDELYRQIGRMKMEIDFLKKTADRLG